MPNKKLIIFDMDDTLITNNKWLDFNIAMGVSEEIAYKFSSQFKAGEISYDQWLELLQAEYKSRAPRETVETVLTAYTLAEGAGEAVAAAKTHGLSIALISGSFSITAEKVAADLGIEHVRANTSCTFVAPDGEAPTAANVAQYFDTLVSGGEEEAAKVLLLQQLCDELKIQLEDCIAVGDGANDITLFELTKCGITFSNSSEAAKSAAAFTIESLHDLDGLLSEIVSV